MTLPYSDDEAEETPWEQPKSRGSARPAGGAQSGSSLSLTPMQLTEVQLHHLLLAKGMVAVMQSSILRRLQRRLCAALQAPSLSSTLRVKLTLDGFEASVLHTKLPLLHHVNGTRHWIAQSHDAFKNACVFPFHSNGFREGKLFKPLRVKEARAICYYTPPMQFTHRTQKVAGVEEASLTVHAQIAMLNHANVLSTASAAVLPDKKVQVPRQKRIT